MGLKNANSNGCNAAIRNLNPTILFFPKTLKIE